MSTTIARIDLHGHRLTARAVLDVLRGFWDARGPEHMPRTIRSGVFEALVFEGWGACYDRERRCRTLENDLGAFTILTDRDFARGDIRIEDDHGRPQAVITNYDRARSEYPELWSAATQRDILDALLRRLDGERPGLRQAIIAAVTP